MKSPHFATGARAQNFLPVSLPSERKCSKDRTRLRMNMLESTMLRLTVLVNFSNLAEEEEEEEAPREELEVSLEAEAGVSTESNVLNASQLNLMSSPSRSKLLWRISLWRISCSTMLLATCCKWKHCRCEQVSSTQWQTPSIFKAPECIFASWNMSTFTQKKKGNKDRSQWQDCS